jgi:Uma2 family endonuclease
MSMKTLLNVDQFLELPQVRDDDYNRYELWQGKLVLMEDTPPYHNWIRDQLMCRIAGFVGPTESGVALGPTGFRLDSNTLYRPDVVFWDSAHWNTIDLHKGGVSVIPQLVVEVKSPSESRVSLFRKADDYIRAGVNTAWVLLERPYEVHVVEAGKPTRVVLPGQKLEAPDLLPGFSIDPAELVPHRT